MKIKLILSEATDEIEEKISAALEEAKTHQADLMEISYGSQAGEKKKRILNFLMKKECRQLYSRLVKSKRAGVGSSCISDGNDPLEESPITR